MDGQQDNPITGPEYEVTAPGSSGVPVMPAEPAAAPAPADYTLRRAVGDSIQAIRANGATIAGLIVLLMLAGIASQAGFAFLVMALVALLGASASAAMVTVLIAGVSILAIWYVVFNAFVVAVLGNAIYEGAEGQRGSIPETLKRGLRMTGKVFQVNVLVFLKAIWPIVAASVLSAILTLVLRPEGGSSTAIFLLLTLLAVIAGMVWMLIVAFRCILAPYVVLFEQGVPVSSSLERSRQLMRDGGTRFVIKLMIAIGIVSAAASALVSALAGEEDAKNSIAEYVLSTLFLLMVNAVMIVFYRHRAGTGHGGAPNTNDTPQTPVTFSPTV